MLGYKRRKLLQLGLAIAGFGLTWSCSRQESKSSTNKPKILVIGAGVSGLAAARELVRDGFEVTVLEGRDRIGGRINTDRSLGSPIDLGASWIHGIRGNPIGKLARELEVPILPTDYDNIEMYGKDGSLLTETEIERLYAIYEKLYYRIPSLAENLEADISIAEAIRRLDISKKLTEREINILQQVLNSEIVTASGADLDSLSLWYADEGDGFGGDDYIFPNGYEQIIQGLARGIDIKLEHKVIEIEYGDRNPSRAWSKVVAEDPPQTSPYKRGGKEAPLVKLVKGGLGGSSDWGIPFLSSLSDSSDSSGSVLVKTNKGNFRADAAIVTLPLGVLKSGTVKFSPALSEEKQAAIARLDMGVLNKVVLKFPKVFWPENREAFGYLSENQQDFTEFFSMTPYTEAPILIAFTGGSFARSLEDLSSEKIVAMAIEPLRRAYGNRIPEPLGVTRTRWKADPFSFGSYSYIPVGATTGDRKVLAEPAGSNLFFAGEATSAKYPATVHGAFLSGIRESDRIKKNF